MVAGALIRSGEVLVAQRPPGHPHAGLWELPGGKVEPGETDEEALVRELDEELGVHIEVIRHLGTTHTETVELVAFIGRILKGKPQALEHSALRWVAPNVLEDLEWPAADRPLIPSLQAHLRTLA